MTMSAGQAGGSGRFLVAMIDGGGTVPPTLGVAAGLVRRGHRVRVLADPTVEPAARAAGCAFTSWRTAPHFNSLAEQTALIGSMESRNPVGQFRAARDLLISGPADRFAADVLTTLDRHPADAILADTVIPGILIGAEAAGLPTAALMPNIYLRPTPGLPMFGTGWRPASGPLGRSGTAWPRPLYAGSGRAPFPGQRGPQVLRPARRRRSRRTPRSLPASAGDDEPDLRLHGATAAAERPLRGTTAR